MVFGLREQLQRIYYITYWQQELICDTSPFLAISTLIGRVLIILLVVKLIIFALRVENLQRILMCCAPEIEQASSVSTAPATNLYPALMWLPDDNKQL